MSTFLYFFPTFPFCRTMYHMAIDCAFENCISDIGMINDEMVSCLIAIYSEAVIYLVLALYLYQVVPQTYGVPKHPLFFLRKLFGKTNFLARMIYGTQ